MLKLPPPIWTLLYLLYRRGDQLGARLAEVLGPASSAARNGSGRGSLHCACLGDRPLSSRRHRSQSDVTTNRALVTEGPYQFTRNPMYLGLVILSLGVAIWVGAWPMFLAPIAVFATANWVHIPFEEDKMRRQFGADYRRLCCAGAALVVKDGCCSVRV